MVLNNRIKAFEELGKFLNQFKPTGYEKVNTVLHNDLFFEKMIQKIESAEHHNGWFTKENVLFSVTQWAEALTTSKLNNWLQQYTITDTNTKTIGVIMAGNIPLVGFHDFLSVLISGHKIIVKQSSNHNQLLPFLVSYLEMVEPNFKNYISFSKRQAYKF